MSQKPKVFKIECEVYPLMLLISIGENDTQFLKSINRNLGMKDMEEIMKEDDTLKLSPKTMARTMMFASGAIVIRFKDKHHVKPDVVSHEIFHAVEFLFRTINLPLVPGSHEAYAYMIGFVTKKFYEKL